MVQCFTMSKLWKIRWDLIITQLLSVLKKASKNIPLKKAQKSLLWFTQPLTTCMSSPREGATVLIISNDKVYAFISTRKASTAKIKPLFTIKLLILPTGAQFQEPGMTLKWKLWIFSGAQWLRSCSHELLPSRLVVSSRRLVQMFV